MSPEELAVQLSKWFTERIPKDWFEGDLEVDADSQEILVVGTLSEPSYDKGASAESKENSRLAVIKTFRDETREARVDIARDAQRLFNRKVSWGVRSGDTTKMFTGLGVPVMTRLRLKDRALLDTLVASGVARSRSEALAWCVSQVASKQKEWIDDLRKATKQVEEVRRKGPDLVRL